MSMLIRKLFGVMLAVVLVVACAPANAEETMTGTIIDFVEEGMVFEEDSTEMQYIVVPSLSMKFTGAQSFSTGLRITLSSYTVDDTQKPARIHPKRVEALEMWPAYVGFVEAVKQTEAGRGVLRVRTTEGVVTDVLVPEGVDAALFSGKAASFSTEIDAAAPDQADMIEARECVLLEVYHGVITKQEAGSIEMEKRMDNELPEKLRFSTGDQTRNGDLLQVGMEVTVAFYPHTLEVFGVAQPN